MLKKLDGDIVSSSDGLNHSDDEAGLKSEKTLVLQSFPEIQIGSLYENNLPIYYCARFLAYNFLLAGNCVFNVLFYEVFS